MSEENSLGEMLSTARRRMGWTQQEVADKFDTPVSRTTVIRWEKDEQRPSDYNIKQLISILGLNEEEADALNRAAGQPTLRIRHLPLRNRLFTGREKQLEQIRRLLKENSSVVLSGLGGIGKTQLALEYAHSSYPDVYRVVFWVDAADRTMLEASYDKILQKLDLPEQHERDQYRRIQAVNDWLEDHTNWLIIMDNADDLPLAHSFFPSAHDGHFLLTTRTQIIGTIASKFQIEQMKPEEGQLFLLRRSDMLKPEATLDDIAEDTRKAALKVVELLDGHPLALDMTGAYIEGGVSFTDYLDHYNEQRRRLLDKYGPLDSEHSDHPESVIVTFKLCFEEAHEQHPIATDILHFCAFLHPDAMPDELFQHDDSFKLDWTAFTKGIAALLRYSLIKCDAQKETFSMHRLVQSVLIDDMSSDLQQQWRDRVVRVLNAAFPEVDFSKLSRCERLHSHALVCATWKDDELTPTLLVAALVHKAGHYSLARGQFSVAETLLSQALSIGEQHLGVSHRNHFGTLNLLATTYLQQRKYEQAELLWQRLLKICELHYGADHPLTADTLHDIAHIYSIQGKYEQVEPLLAQAFSIYKQHLGTEHIKTVYVLASQAGLYLHQNKYEQAESLFRRVLKICEEHLEADNSTIAVAALNGLSTILISQGKYDQAEALDQRVTSHFEKLLGATHPVTLRVINAHTELRHIYRGYDAEAAALAINDEPSV